MLLLFDKNCIYYERYIKQTSPRQFLILINDSDLREIDLHQNITRNWAISPNLGHKIKSCPS